MNCTGLMVQLELNGARTSAEDNGRLHTTMIDDVTVFSIVPVMLLDHMTMAQCVKNESDGVEIFSRIITIRVDANLSPPTGNALVKSELN